MNLTISLLAVCIMSLFDWARAAQPQAPIPAAAYRILEQRIAYGPDKTLQVADIYQPRVPACSRSLPGCKPPVALLVHGGKNICDPNNYEVSSGQAELLAWAGFFVVLAQSESSSAKCPNPPNHDIGSLQLMVRWIRVHGPIHHWNFDPSKIVVIGGSFSGYNALMLGEWGWAGIQPSEFSHIYPNVSSHVQAVIDQFGPVSGPNGSVVKNMITPRSVPTFIIQGIHDCRVRKSNSDRIRAALVANGIPVVERLYDGGHDYTQWTGPTCASQPRPLVSLERQFMYDQLYPAIQRVMAWLDVVPAR